MMKTIHDFLANSGLGEKSDTFLRAVLSMVDDASKTITEEQEEFLLEVIRDYLLHYRRESLVNWIVPSAEHLSVNDRLFMRSVATYLNEL
jgi:hypothetical protein